MAEGMRVLADPARLQILKELASNQDETQLSVCDLARRLDISQPNVPHRLKVLGTAGFMACRRYQRFCYYSVNLDTIDAALRQVYEEIASCSAAPCAAGLSSACVGASGGTSGGG